MKDSAQNTDRDGAVANNAADYLCPLLFQAPVKHKFSRKQERRNKRKIKWNPFGWVIKRIQGMSNKNIYCQKSDIDYDKDFNDQ